jgi:PhnB protein
MVANPPENMLRITPYLYYEDVSAALDWLAVVFGFKERMRLPGPDGGISHAEMECADGVIMLGCPADDYRNPSRLGQVTQSLYVYVDDVDKHFERAKAAGAKILDEPEDQFYGDRRYTTEDLEGHHWFFATHLRVVAPEDLVRPT